MAKFWKKDGKLVRDADGRFIKCDDCPCDTGPALVCGEISLPRRLYATFTGSFSGLGTKTLTYDAGTNSWKTAVLTPCPFASGYYELGFICVDDVLVVGSQSAFRTLAGTYIMRFDNVATSYSPVLIDATGNSSVTPFPFGCSTPASGYTITITDTPP